jgi:anti-sigma regulatory factor (Ser/Thr protein kinase)
MEQHIEVLAENASLPRLIAFSDAIEAELPLTFEQSYLMRLAIEEVATNIIKYGYARGVPGPIQVGCTYEDGLLRVIFRDQGQPFDPASAPNPDLGDDLSTRAIGGLGIFLVRQMADELHYRHDPASGWNELVVVKGQGSDHV